MSSVFAISIHCAAELISNHSPLPDAPDGVYVGLICERIESSTPYFSYVSVSTSAITAKA